MNDALSEPRGVPMRCIGTFAIIASQERIEPTFKLIFPLRRFVHYGRPSKSRPPMNY